MSISSQKEQSFSFQDYDNSLEESIFKPDLTIYEILNLITRLFLDPCSYIYCKDELKATIKCYSITNGKKDVVLNSNLLSNPLIYIFILPESNHMFCLTSSELVKCIMPISERLKVENGFYSLKYKHTYIDKENTCVEECKGAHICIIKETTVLDLQSWLFTFDSNSPMFLQPLFKHIKRFHPEIASPHSPTPFSVYDMITLS